MLRGRSAVGLIRSGSVTAHRPSPSLSALTGAEAAEREMPPDPRRHPGRRPAGAGKGTSISGFRLFGGPEFRSLLRIGSGGCAAISFGDLVIAQRWGHAGTRSPVGGRRPVRRCRGRDGPLLHPGRPGDGGPGGQCAGRVRRYGRTRPGGPRSVHRPPYRSVAVGRRGNRSGGEENPQPPGGRAVAAGGDDPLPGRPAADPRLLATRRRRGPDGPSPPDRTRTADLHRLQRPSPRAGRHLPHAAPATAGHHRRAGQRQDHPGRAAAAGAP